MLDDSMDPQLIQALATGDMMAVFRILAPQLQAWLSEAQLKELEQQLLAEGPEALEQLRGLLVQPREPAADLQAVYAQVALQFAQRLMAQDFAQAYQMLSPALKAQLSRKQMKRNYQELLLFTDGPVEHCQVMNTMEDWPARQPDDLGWAYVAISGLGFNEAVTVIVSGAHGTALIREIEWGRP